jgi:hypothetical protein
MSKENVALTASDYLQTDVKLHDHDSADDEALSAQALDEEIALLEGTDLRKKAQSDEDGGATYQHETWGFIGKLGSWVMYARGV